MSRSRPTRRAVPSIVTALVLAIVVPAGAGCGAGDGQPEPAQAATAYAGRPVPGPAKAAPPLALRDAGGRHVDLARYRGKAVLVTFLYTRCPDVCPLIADHLRAARERLGARAGELRLVAVSTDPRGDTPAAVRRFLRVHRLTGEMDYLVGSRAQLARAWRAWGISAQPGARPEEIEHTAAIFGVDAAGDLATMYDPGTPSADLAHDVPLLAAR